MGYKIRLSDGRISKRYKDDNGYLHIPNNQIAKAGVFDYLLKEVSDCPPDQADEIVRVCRSFDDLKANKDLFSKIPIVLGHHWVGEEQDKVAGVIGEVITAQEPYLYADLIIYSKELIEAIENKQIVELSPAYQADILEVSGEYDGEPYQYEQKLKSVNHLAVVENGRSGSDLRLQDERIPKQKGAKMSIKAALKALLKRVEDEAIEEKEEKVQDSQVDKRELVKEILAIAAKPNDEFEGGEEEKFETLLKKLELIAYEPSKVEDEDEESKKTEDDDAEPSKVEDEDEAEESKKLADSLERIIDAKFGAFERKLKKINDANTIAYAEVSKAVGDFNSSGMSASDIYSYGYKCLSKRTLDSGIDAKSAFKVKLAELQNQHQAPKFQDSKSKDTLSDAHSKLLANIK